MNLDLNQLRAFVAVAEMKSFSKASDRLCRVQSAVSQQVQKLESCLGSRLFIRSRGGVMLTDAGEDLLVYALKLLSLNDQAVDVLMHERPREAIRLGTSDSFASLFLPEILKRYAAHNPECTVEVKCGSSRDVWNMYDLRSVDIALAQNCPPAISSELLFVEPLHWICASESSVGTWDPLPLALWEAGSPDRDLILGALHRVHKRYRIAYETNGREALLAAVKSGNFISATLLRPVDSMLRILGADDGYPPLGNVEIYLACSDSASGSPMSKFGEVTRECFASKAS